MMNLPTQNWMYIGPNILRLGLKFNTLYLVEELPPGLEKLVKDNPILATLYVPTSQISRAIANIPKPGTAENLAYSQIMTVTKTFPKSL